MWRAWGIRLVGIHDSFLQFQYWVDLCLSTHTLLLESLYTPSLLVILYDFDFIFQSKMLPFSQWHPSLLQLTARLVRTCAVTYKCEKCLTTSVKRLASQIATTNTSRLAVKELNSFVWGYHAYQNTWTPFIREGLLLRREPENADRSAVSVQKDGETVSHIPFNIYNVVSHFFRGEFNKGFAELTGEMVNRGACYDLEISCIYRFYRPQPYVIELHCKRSYCHPLWPTLTVDLASLSFRFWSCVNRYKTLL